MSQSKLSKSKTRLLLQKVPSTDILHKGYQRKIAQSEYIKTFPKMRLRLNGKANTVSILKNQCSEEYIWGEIENMKDENKRLEETNQELVARIRKESKFNELYEKKMDKIAIEAMPFEKILEIKLLLEVEELEEMLRNKEENLEQLIKTNKKKKESLHHSILDPFVDLHALLLEDSASVSRKRQEREDELKQSDDNLNELYQVRQKLKNTHRQRLLEFNNAKLNVEKQNLLLPNKKVVVQESNENSAIGGANRTKNIQDLESQIQKLHSQYKEYEIKVQHEIDNKVKQKLSIIKEMQQVNENIQKLKHFGKNRALQVIDW